ncbi:MAG: 5'-deoxynucleotidase [Clostridia bacterium]|nr:5'-deoxynucleotidase [Clostridia bacterium]
MNHHFFAYVSRLRYIRRWGLMRSVMPENDAEHSLQVAMIAHAIAIMGRDRYGRQVDPEHVLALGVYHDVSEVITGDMPTPVKYQTDELRRSYKDVERMANERLLSMLPEGLRPAYAPYLSVPADEERQILKAADSISAYLKCLEEKRAGNREFDAAGESIKAALDQIGLPEVQDFIREFVPSFELSLDELNQPGSVPLHSARD